MKPMGRKYYQDKTGGKHSQRLFGKFNAWWANIIEPNKQMERQKAKRDIQREIDA